MIELIPSTKPTNGPSNWDDVMEFEIVPVDIFGRGKEEGSVVEADGSVF